MVLRNSRRTLSKNMVTRTQLMKTWCKSDERSKFPRQKCPVGPLKPVCTVSTAQVHGQTHCLGPTPPSSLTERRRLRKPWSKACCRWSLPTWRVLGWIGSWRSCSAGTWRPSARSLTWVLGGDICQVTEGLGRPSSCPRLAEENCATLYDRCLGDQRKVNKNI